MFKSPDNAVEMLLKASVERIHGNNFDFEFRCPETTITLFVGNYSGTEKSQQFPLKTDQLVSHLEPPGINSDTTKWDTSDFYQMLFGLPRVGIAGVMDGRFRCPRRVFFVREGRRVNSRSPWPGAGGSRSRISLPKRRRKGLPNQTDSASVRCLMKSTATRMESRPVIDTVRGEFSFVGDDRRGTLVRRGRELVVRALGFQRRDGEERAFRFKRLPLFWATRLGFHLFMA